MEDFASNRSTFRIFIIALRNYTRTNLHNSLWNWSACLFAHMRNDFNLLSRFLSKKINRGTNNRSNATDKRTDMRKRDFVQATRLSPHILHGVAWPVSIETLTLSRDSGSLSTGHNGEGRLQTVSEEIEKKKCFLRINPLLLWKETTVMEARIGLNKYSNGNWVGNKIFKFRT